MTNVTTMATSVVTSKDGTNIGYRRSGQGPGLVVLHGAMSSSQTHSQLAEALAADFTVYVADRRGIPPKVTRTEFAGLGHAGSGNADSGGRPDQVAAALSGFFAPDRLVSPERRPDHSSRAYR